MEGYCEGECGAVDEEGEDLEYESIVTEYLENERRKQGGGTGTGENLFNLDDLKEDETPGRLQKSCIPQAAASDSEAEAGEDEGLLEESVKVDVVFYIIGKFLGFGCGLDRMVLGLGFVIKGGYIR